MKFYELKRRRASSKKQKSSNNVVPANSESGASVAQCGASGASGASAVVSAPNNSDLCAKESELLRTLLHTNSSEDSGHSDGSDSG